MDLARLDATDMARLLAANEISSEELVTAHLARIDAVEPRLHAFVEVHHREALAGARRADEERRRGEVRGPLHGLPVTLKESLDVAGRAPTLGISARRRQLARNDAVVVEGVRRAGGIPIGRTNVPQLLLSHETANPVFGTTSNPWSLAHGPGGSSGGEGAAIAAGASALGVGTDIGGSIRVPAHFCGIAGLKPTLDRWSNLGSNGAQPGQEIVRSQCGPMARTARDLALFFGALDPVAMGERDPLVPPVALRDPASIDPTRLRVGYFVDDGIVPASASVRRAVRVAADALERAGVAVQPFLPPGIEEAAAIYFGAMSADGGATATSILEGDPLEPSLARFRRVATMPAAARAAIAAGLRLRGDRRAADVVTWVGERTTTGLWELTRRARAYRLRLLGAMRDAGLDALLCPAHATPALPHGLGRDFTPAGFASMLFNLVQFPAGVVPVTTVAPDETGRAPGAGRLEANAADVDARSGGLPVGVQVVGAPWRDEEVLALLLALERALASHADRPLTPRELR